LVSIALNIAITATWVCKLKLELVSVLATLAKAVPKLSKLEEYVSKSDKAVVKSLISVLSRKVVFF
jgi:hypothetical protein